MHYKFERMHFQRLIFHFFYHQAVQGKGNLTLFSLIEPITACAAFFFGGDSICRRSFKIL